MSHDSRQLIYSHIATERTTDLRAKNNEYVFRVAKKANKHVIKKAVENAFNVKVVDVRTLVVPGKTRRVGRHPEGRTLSWKKAFVRLKEGEVIAIFEG